jgi:putative spermidine/putrescine transport system permease protein
MFRKIMTVLVVIFLVLPIFIVIPISFSSAQYLTFPPPGFSLQWYKNFFSDSQWTDAAIKSIEVGVATTILSLILGTMAAVGITRSEFPGKSIIQNIFLLPIVVPAVIVGISVYDFQSKTGMIGSVGGLIIAHTIMAMPIVISTLMSSLTGVDPNLENAAQNLGANYFQAFMKVTLHIIRPALFSSAIFAFVTSFDELVVTMFICGVSANTLPKQMWDGIKTQIDPTIAAVSSLLIGFLITSLLIYQVFMKSEDSNAPTGAEEVIEV